MSESLDHVDGAQVSAGRKVQLERYEPIEEHVTLDVNLPDDATTEEKEEIIADAEQVAWRLADEGVMRRYEEHVREDES